MYEAKLENIILPTYPDKKIFMLVKLRYSI